MRADGLVVFIDSKPSAYPFVINLSFILINDGKEQIVRSVIGADGLREFIMLPEWTVNNFVSTIMENHFKTLRDNCLILDSIPIRLPYKSEKCYYDGVEGVGVYE